MIPKCKLWRATMEDGRVYEVTAPTKRLAILNLRYDETAPVWGPIAKVGMIRGGELPRGVREVK